MEKNILGSSNQILIMYFKDKGVVLISILLIVLLLSSVAVIFGNKYLLSLKRAQFIEFQSISLNSFRNIESLSYKVISNELRFNSNKLSKNNPILKNSFNFDFDKKKFEDLLLEILSNKNEILIKKNNLEKLNYQNTWNNVNQNLLNIINEY